MRRSFTDLVDRIRSSRCAYRIARGVSRLAREPDIGRILLVLGLAVLGITIVIWAHHPRRIEPAGPVKVRPMVSPDQMRGVLQQAERSRYRR